MGMQAVLNRFVDETDVIEASFHSCAASDLAGLSTFASTPLEDGCLVALWDAWGRFLRDAVLTSCSGPVMGLAGNVYTPTVPVSEVQALTYLKAQGHCGSYSEPTWHSTQVLGSVIRALQVPNRTTIMNGIGVVSVAVGTGSIANPLQELRACRNFVAHKTSENVAKLRRFGALAHPDLKSHLRAKRQGVEHFIDLLDGCRAVAGAALN